MFCWNDLCFDYAWSAAALSTTNKRRCLGGAGKPYINKESHSPHIEKKIVLFLNKSPKQMVMWSLLRLLWIGLLCVCNLECEFRWTSTSTMICPILNPNFIIWYAITMPGVHVFSRHINRTIYLSRCLTMLLCISWILFTTLLNHNNVSWNLFLSSSIMVSYPA